MTAIAILWNADRDRELFATAVDLAEAEPKLVATLLGSPDSLSPNIRRALKAALEGVQSAWSSFTETPAYLGSALKGQKP